MQQHNTGQLAECIHVCYVKVPIPRDQMCIHLLLCEQHGSVHVVKQVALNGPIINQAITQSDDRK